MSGTNIALSLPPNLRVPLFYAQFDNSQAGASQQNQNALLLGQSTTQPPVAVTYIESVAQAAQLFGPASMIAKMVAAYFANDPVTPLYAIPYWDAGGSTAATGAIGIVGTAPKSGALCIYIDGQLITVGVNAGDTAITIAANGAAAINAYTYSFPGLSQTPLKLPVTAVQATSGSEGFINLTAVNNGTLGNGIPVVLNFRGSLAGESLPAGISSSVVAMSGGAGDPTMTGSQSLATLCGKQNFDFICNPWATTTELALTSALMNDQSGRWSYSVAQYGHVFSAKVDTSTNLLALGSALNDQHLTVFGINPASPTSAPVWAAAIMGACAPSLQAQPNQPLQTLVVQGVLGAPAALDFSFSNDQALLTSGIATVATNQAGQVHIVRACTTYQANAYGQPDQSYLDTETPYLLMAITRRLKSVVTQKYPRALLAANGTPAGFGSVVVTPDTVKNDLIAEYAAMSALGWVQSPQAFAKALICQINANDNSRLDVLFAPYLVSGLRIFATLVQFHLQAGAA